LRGIHGHAWTTSHFYRRFVLSRRQQSCETFDSLETAEDYTAFEGLSSLHVRDFRLTRDDLANDGPAKR